VQNESAYHSKRVPDPEAKLKVDPSGNGIVTQGLKFVVNPFDEIAIEEGLKIKEKHKAEAVVVSIGKKESTEQLRTGLAMGADRAILVLTDDGADSEVVARILAKVYESEKPDIVLMGKQAVDDDMNQAGQLLAEYLGIPQATFASKVELSADLKSAKVTREVDGGLETVDIQLPAVITADLRLNTPRYASLPGIMKAKTKPLKEIPVAELGVQVKPKVKMLKLEEPPKRKGGIKVETVQELVLKLKNEAKVL
jgi:electron transfer flavoprotein beta subunit